MGEATLNVSRSKEFGTLGGVMDRVGLRGDFGSMQMSLEELGVVGPDIL